MISGSAPNAGRVMFTRFALLICALVLASCDFDEALTDPPADTGFEQPCDACAAECGDDVDCFNECAADIPGCSQCLDPFFDCRDQSAAGECSAEFCACVDDQYCG